MKKQIGYTLLCALLFSTVTYSQPYMLQIQSIEEFMRDTTKATITWIRMIDNYTQDDEQERSRHLITIDAMKRKINFGFEDVYYIPKNNSSGKYLLYADFVGDDITSLYKCSIVEKDPITVIITFWYVKGKYGSKISHEARIAGFSPPFNRIKYLRAAIEVAETMWR